MQGTEIQTLKTLKTSSPDSVPAVTTLGAAQDGHPGGLPGGLGTVHALLAAVHLPREHGPGAPVEGGKEADRGLKAKVAVPRLNGGRMGVLATRSPHRPCPIGAFPTSVALYVALNVVLLWPYRGLKQKGSGFVIVWCMF